MTTTRNKTMGERWSDGVLPFMLGMIVALGSVLIVMFTINLLIVTKLVLSNA